VFCDAFYHNHDYDHDDDYYHDDNKNFDHDFDDNNSHHGNHHKCSVRSRLFRPWLHHDDQQLLV